MKFTVPHGIASVFCGLAALLPVIQTVAPATMPGPTGIAVAGGIGLALTLGHSVWDGIKADVVVKALFLGLAIGAVVGTSAPLSGCATLAKVDTVVTAPGSQPYVVLLGQGIVLGAEAKGLTATEINILAKTALQADSGTTASLAAIDAAVNAEVGKLKLPAIDSGVLTLFEAAVTEAVLNSGVGNNATLAQTQAAVADVLNAVIAASGG